jgi:2-iminobutanoate/2-iminopropanoate deaminase
MTKPQREEIHMPGWPPAISHYCDAVRHGDTLYISGLWPFGDDGKLHGAGDAHAQCEIILRRMGEVLARVGAGPADVLKVTVYLTNIDDRTRINPARQAFFGAAKPASTLVEVSRLAIPGMLVEIEAVAAIPG